MKSKKENTAAPIKVKKSNFKANLVIAISFVLLLTIAGVAYFLLSSMESLNLKGDYYQYRIGLRFDYKEKSKMIKQENGTVVAYGGEEYLSDVFPVYSCDKFSFVIPEDMALVLPINRIQYCRVAYFTEVYYETESVFIKRANKQSSVSGGFLHDGLDTYIFLDPMVLNFGDNEVSVGKFTTIRALQNNLVEIYDYENDKYQLFEELGICDMVAKSDKGYSVNFGTDTVTVDNDQYMLTNSPSMLPDFFDLGI